MMRFEPARETFLVTALAVMLTGCVESVVLGGEEEQGDGGAGGGSETTGPAAEPLVPGSGTTATSTSTSTVTPTSTVASTSTGPSSSTASGGAAAALTATVRRNSPELEAQLCETAYPCDVPDETIFLIIDPDGEVCGDLEEGVSSWRMFFPLLPERQAVGTYDIDGDDPLELWWGLAVWPGPLEIVAIDGLDLTVRVNLQPNDLDAIVGETLDSQTCD